MKQTIRQSVDIDIYEVFRKTMILLNYQEFAELIERVVKQSDDPKVLANKIKTQLENVT